MEFVTTNLQSLNEYRIVAQGLAWSHKLEIGASLYLLLSSFWGRRFWLNSQFYVMFVLSGLPMVVCPQTYLSYLSETSDKMDETHVYLMRSVGILILTQTLSYWLLSKSSDSTTETSQLWAYTVEVGCVVLAKAYLYTHPGKKTGAKLDDQILSVSFMTTSMIFLVNLFYALRSTDWGGYTEQLSRKNTHVRLDSLLLFVFGVMWFVSPSLFLNCQTEAANPDAINTYLCRILGAFLFYNAILSARSVAFLRDNDKDAVIFSHLIGYLMLIGVFAVGQVRNWENMSVKNAALMSVDEIFLIFNSIVAMSVDIPKYLTKTLVPRVMQVPQDLQRIIKRKRF